MLKNQKPTLAFLKDIGMQFPNDKSTTKKRFGIYLCECGKEFKTQIQDAKSGRSSSCGCTRMVHGLRTHPLYQTWNNMMQRTNNINSTYYKNYGGRGIVVCERWLDVSNFIEDMYPSYKKGLTLDRIDNDGNYEQSNCRWVCRHTQMQNTRRIRVTNTSGYRGVCFHKQKNKWGASIRHNGKQKHIGYYNTSIDAAKAYDKYVTENNLEHTINFIIDYDTI